MVMDSRRVQRSDAYVTYTATRTVDGADERAAIGCLLRSRPERVKWGDDLRESKVGRAFFHATPWSVHGGWADGTAEMGARLSRFHHFHGDSVQTFPGDLA